ncbi:unnamed protein product [Tilletia controversa]|nr:unnamed protein product [Tilletia controversa]
MDAPRRKSLTSTLSSSPQTSRPARSTPSSALDGSALVPQGGYTAAQDYDHTIVQRCIHERKLAPFYKSFDDDQPDAQSIADAYSHLSHFTRCCEQPICTECFVQIKRADPNHTNPPSSEPATCPYCMEANFGVVYRPPPSFLVKGPGAGAGTGMVGEGHGALAAVAAAGNMASTIGAAATGTIANARRRKSFGHTDPEVITIDMIRPDWEDKLRQAHAAIARRANRRIIMRQVGDRLTPIGVSSSRAGAELPDGLIQGPGGSHHHHHYRRCRCWCGEWTATGNR